MTDIQVRFADGGGQPVTLPAGAVLVWRPVRNGGTTGTRVSTADAFVTAPRTVALDTNPKLVTGVTPVPVAADWVWEVREVGFPGARTRYVRVPDSPTPVQYEDLVDVDPRSLPVRDAEQAWFAALGDVDTGLRQYVDGTLTAGGNVPSPVGADEGDVLTVAAGAPVWAAPTGGGTGDVPSTRRVDTTVPLVGGGDLSVDRTLSVLVGTTPSTVAAGSAPAAARADHEAAADPHPQYLTQPEGDSRYALAGTVAVAVAAVFTGYAAAAAAAVTLPTGALVVVTGGS